MAAILPVSLFFFCLLYLSRQTIEFQILRHNNKPHGSRLKQFFKHPPGQSVALGLQAFAQFLQDKQIIIDHLFPRMLLKQRIKHLHGDLAPPPRVGHHIQQVLGRKVVIDLALPGVGDPLNRNLGILQQGFCA